MPASSPWWGRKVARLPERGTLIAATDLQGNYDDYEALKQIYFREEAEGNEPVLLLCGDLVHGPGPDYDHPCRWPDYLGTFYLDRSKELILDYEDFAAEHRTVALLGNHEHSHIGGPVVSKFHPDEAAVLEQSLGERSGQVRRFLETWPLLAVAPCGATFTHGAPRATEPDLESFESLRYDGYARTSIGDMYESGTVGSLLWARYADPERARAFLHATREGEGRNAFVAFGHDVVRDGYEKIGDEQICVSTSFGCDNQNKTYLRVDLGSEYASVHDLKIGREILPLYPEAK